MFSFIFRNAIRDTGQTLLSTGLGLSFFHGGKMIAKKANSDRIKLKPEAKLNNSSGTSSRTP